MKVPAAVQGDAEQLRAGGLLQRLNNLVTI
jgi:hypothetical protein